MGVLVSKAGALGHLGKTDEAKQTYQTLTKGLVVEKVGPNAILGAWAAYADFLTDLGDIEGAKAAWQSCKDALSGINARPRPSSRARPARADRQDAAPPETARTSTARSSRCGPLRQVLLVTPNTWWPCVAELPGVRHVQEVPARASRSS
jgi:hypothetical protein